MKQLPETKYFAYIENKVGNFALVYTQTALCQLKLTLKSKEAIFAQLQKEEKAATLISKTTKPTWYKDLENKLKAYSKNKVIDFSKVPLDLESKTDFRKKIYKVAQKIPYAKTMSYKELAAKCGRPKAARAVGSAMAQNPVLLVIPCHRVLPQNKKTLGGFSAPGGVKTKAKLLKIENSSSAL